MLYCYVASYWLRCVVVYMKIPFSQISTAGHQYSLDVPDIDTENEIFSLQGMTSLSCMLTRKGSDQILVQGRMSATLLLTCDRCLRIYSQNVDTGLDFICEINGSRYQGVREIDLTARELDIMQLEEAVIDLGEIIRQQLYLSVPQQRLCAHDCKGICPICGADRNSSPCRCSGVPIHNPFAVLAAVKGK